MIKQTDLVQVPPATRQMCYPNLTDQWPIVVHNGYGPDRCPGLPKFRKSKQGEVTTCPKCQRLFEYIKPTPSPIIHRT